MPDKHLQGVTPRRQTAHVDGALAFYGEEHHHLAVHVFTAIMFQALTLFDINCQYNSITP